jgi:hypothetical protein
MIKILSIIFLLASCATTNKSNFVAISQNKTELSPPTKTRYIYDRFEVEENEFIDSKQVILEFLL